MSEENSKAPAETAGGQEIPADLRTEDALAKSDEELRRLAVARLAEHLDIGSSLVTRCEELANARSGDRLGPLYAAARLMQANARVAQALAHVAKVERRSRTIIEYIQPVAPVSADLNSTFEDSTYEKSLERELRLKMLRYMKLLASETFDGALSEMPDDATDPPAQESAAPARPSGPGADPA